MSSINNDLFAIKTEVLDALQKNQPVVALESTLISHGLPWPENKTVGLEIEVPFLWKK
jgi:pseudouridine-5'-phosphate glycosidase